MHGDRGSRGTWHTVAHWEDWEEGGVGSRACECRQTTQGTRVVYLSAELAHELECEGEEWGDW